MSKDMVDGGGGGDLCWLSVSQKANRDYTDFRNNYCCCQ